MVYTNSRVSSDFRRETRHVFAVVGRVRNTLTMLSSLEYNCGRIIASIIIAMVLRFKGDKSNEMLMCVQNTMLTIHSLYSPYFGHRYSRGYSLFVRHEKAFLQHLSCLRPSCK
jgi:hypothetical protein